MIYVSLCHCFAVSSTEKLATSHARIIANACNTHHVKASGKKDTQYLNIVRRDEYEESILSPSHAETEKLLSRLEEKVALNL